MTIVLGSNSHRELAAIKNFCADNGLRCPKQDDKCDWVTLRLPEVPYQRLSDALCAHGYKLELFRHATFTADCNAEVSGTENDRSSGVVFA